LNLGAALVAGKVYTWSLLEDFLQESAVLELSETMFRQYLVLSDPSLQIYTETPVVVSADLPPAIPAGLIDLDVTIQNLASVSADSVLFTVWYESGSFENYWIRRESPSFTIPVNAQIDQQIYLTITGDNVAAFQQMVEVNPMGPFVIHNSMEIQDSQGGNDNGLIEPGETIQWFEEVWNVGDSTAGNVSVTLSSESEIVTIIDHELQFGTVAVNQTVTASNPFTFTIDPSVPDTSMLSFSLLFQADFTAVRFSEVEVALCSPNIRTLTMVVDDGGDGVFGRWESADLLIQLKNSGNVASASGSLQLSTSDPYLSIVNGWAAIPAIEPQDTYTTPTNSLRVHASGITPSAHIAELTMHVSVQMDRYLYERDLPLAVMIGRIESGDPLSDTSQRYWLYDNTDAIYEQAPEYNWIEISPSVGGAGEEVHVEANQQTFPLPVPFSFNYYGTAFDTLSISVDGWVQPGSTTAISSNTDFLPYALDSVKGMIAPLWGNLWDTPVETETGDLSYFYHEASDRFIVEWRGLHHSIFNSEGFYDTFQLHLLNPATYPTESGDAEWLFMYQHISPIAATREGYTVGIEDPQSLEGATYVVDGDYAAAAAALDSGRAIRVTTVPPTILDTGEIPTPIPSDIYLAQNYPNPFNPETNISFTLPSMMKARLEVFNILGSRVATLIDSPMPEGTHLAVWNGKSDAGVMVSSGIYIYRLATPQVSLSRKMVLLK
jgi:hypothetical protein